MPRNRVIGKDVMFVREEDPHLNRLGVKGLGEIAMVGVAPAIVYAIHHATGGGYANFR